jgi:hypothetical protein
VGDEVPRIIGECHEEARGLLGEHLEELEAPAATLGGSALAGAAPNDAADQDTGRSAARG